jgi:flagellar basal body rod protein FlgF
VATQSPQRTEPTADAALAAFARLYVNWSFQTLSAQQRELAAMSVGAARLVEQQAAASSQSDSTITRGHIHNTGRVVSIARDLTGSDGWVVVTREQTGGNAHYQGLPAGYHVTLAQLAAVPGGWAVSQWLPQS